MQVQTTFVNGISPWSPFIPRPKSTRVRRKSHINQPQSTHQIMRDSLIKALTACARYQTDLINDTGLTARQLTNVCTYCQDILSERVIYEGASNVIYWIKDAPPPITMRSHPVQAMAIISKHPWMSSSKLPWSAKENQRVAWWLEQQGDIVSRTVLTETVSRGIRPIKQYKVKA